MVLLMSVANGGEVKSIGFSVDSICVYTVEDPFSADDIVDVTLWTTESWNALAEKYTLGFAVDCMWYFESLWKYSDSLQDEYDIRAALRLRNFTNAASQLFDRWEDNLNDGYPFNKDFESVLVDIVEWQQRIFNK